METVPQEGTLLLFIALVPLAVGFGIPSFLEFGECANVEVYPDFNFDRYSGIWFDIENVPNEYIQVKDCAMTKYTWNDHHGIMTVLKRGLNSEGKKVKQLTEMRRNGNETGAFTVHAEGVPTAPYKIIATDYESFSCVYSCMSFFGFRAAFSWVLSRTPTPAASLIDFCRDVMTAQGIQPESLVAVKQGKDCPYWSKLDSLTVYRPRLQSLAKANGSGPDTARARGGDNVVPTGENMDEATQGHGASSSLSQPLAACLVLPVILSLLRHLHHWA